VWVRLPLGALNLNKMKLFLDDIRHPEDCAAYMPSHLSYLYSKEKWITVRDYNEFVDFITSEGLPELISFDHDLADEHYSPLETSDLYREMEATPELVDRFYNENFVERTGYHCARWLIDYCIDNNQKLPQFLVHSMNPTGKINIQTLLEQFKKHQNA
jgi:hypothetical protein